MTLEELFEAAKARWPGFEISVSHWLQTDQRAASWYCLNVHHRGDPLRACKTAATPEECLAEINVMGRAQYAQKLIEAGQAILAEEPISPRQSEEVVLK